MSIPRSQEKQNTIAYLHGPSNLIVRLENPWKLEPASLVHTVVSKKPYIKEDGWQGLTCEAAF